MKRGHLLVVTAVLLVALASSAQAAVRPLVFHHPVADPSVAQAPNGKYVAVATGPQVVRAVSKNGHVWHTVRSALQQRPAWAEAKGGIWASDIERLGRRWLLYFAAPVRVPGGATDHCIGVAVSATSTGTFVPVGDTPLVCPPHTHHSRGAIDPSLYRNGNRLYLLFKVDGKPSSIRILKLRRGGTRAFGTPSKQLVASRGVVENPVILKRGRFFYLFTSAGSYSSCSYETTVRRSRSLTRWHGHRARRLLTSRSTGLCGPGGADIVQSKHGTRLYFHAWVCGGKRPCKGHPHGKDALRALYAVRLRFTHRGWPTRGAAVR